MKQPDWLKLVSRVSTYSIQWGHINSVNNVLKCVYHVNSKIVPSWKKLTNLSDTLDHNNRSR